MTPVAPNSNALSKRFCMMSTTYTLETPIALSAIMVTSPMQPEPVTTAVWPACAPPCCAAWKPTACLLYTSPLKRFFNTSGMLYKEMNLKEKLPAMTEEEQLALLGTNGMLVKRPLIIADDFILVGFKEKEWQSHLIK